MAILRFWCNTGMMRPYIPSTFEELQRQYYYTLSCSSESKALPPPYVAEHVGPAVIGFVLGGGVHRGSSYYTFGDSSCNNRMVATKRLKK